MVSHASLIQPQQVLCSPPQTTSSLHSLRGQQQRSLCAALQGFTCCCFVRKLHKASPSGTTAVICHDNSPFHRPKLRKRLMERKWFPKITAQKSAIQKSRTRRKWPNIPILLNFRDAYLFQQLICHCRQQVAHCERSTMCSKADPD